MSSYKLHTFRVDGSIKSEPYKQEPSLEYFGKQAVDISIELQLISLYISSNEGFCLYGSVLIEPSTLNVCNL